MKPKTPRNPNYLKFVRGLPCSVSGVDYNVVAAHVRIGSCAGIGLKPSDFRTVPLSTELHMRQHQIGERSFWKEACIYQEDAIFDTIIAFLRLQPKTPQLNELLGEIIEKMR